MSNFKPYVDTDSVNAEAKQILNSLYGRENTMKRDYVTVIVDNKPTVIFKRNIVSISKLGNKTEIICVGDIQYIASNEYPSVVKQMLN